MDVRWAIIGTVIATLGGVRAHAAQAPPSVLPDSQAVPVRTSPGSDAQELISLPQLPPASAPADSGGGSTQRLTLQDCLRLARAHNLQYQNDYENLLSSHAQLMRARAPFSPQANATFKLPTYSEFRDVEENPALSRRITEERSTFLYRGQINASQRIPHMGKLSVVSSAQRQQFSSNVRADYLDVVGDLRVSYSNELLHPAAEEISLRQAELNFTSARKRYRSRELTLEGRVTTAYYDLVESIRQLEIQKQRLQQSQANLELAQRKFEIGLIAEVEALRLRVTMLNAQANYAQAQTVIERRRDALREVLGMDMNQPLDVVTDVQFQEHQVDPRRALELGLRRRTDMQETEIAEQVRKLNLANTRRRNGINATLNASVSLLGRGDQLSDISRHLGRNYWDVGLQITMPVLDGGDRRGQVRQAEIQVKQARLEREITRQAVIRDIRDAVRNLDEAQRQIVLRKASLEVSERTYEVEKSRFELGLAQSQELLNAQADQTAARISALDAIINYQRQLLNLRLATMADVDELAPRREE